MAGKKKSSLLTRLTVGALGIICALVLAVLFYGTMVYQLAGEEAGAPQGARLSESPAPLVAGAQAASQFPGRRLKLSGGTLAEEQILDVPSGGETCRVLVRTYSLEGGGEAKAVSAAGAAYLEQAAAQGYVPQLITGFALAGMDAVYALRGGDALLTARDGDFVYMLLCAGSEQAVYALGAGAALEE